MSESDTF